MSTIDIIFLFRGFERLLIQAGAIVCVVSGVRLLRSSTTTARRSGGNRPQKVSQKRLASSPATSEATPPSEDGAGFSAEGLGVSIKLTHAAPGTVLALFGMSVMGVALAMPAKVKDLLPEAKANVDPPHRASQNDDESPGGETPGTASAGGSSSRENLPSSGGSTAAPAKAPAKAKAQASNTAAGSGDTLDIQYQARVNAADAFIGTIAHSSLRDPARAMPGLAEQAGQYLAGLKPGPKRDFLAALSGWKASAQSDPAQAYSDFQGQARQLVP